jgi:hypothetical protein
MPRRHPIRRRRSTTTVLVAALCVAAAACAGAQNTSVVSPQLSQPTPSPANTATAAAKQQPPLVVIVMENHELVDVMASSTPYEHALVREGRSYANYFAVAHPSLPNYLALASGSTAGKTTDDISAGEIGGTTLWDQLSAAGVSWGVYEETMPTPCYQPYAAGSAPNDYALKHNPATPFRSVYSDAAQCRRVQPLTAMDPHHLPEMSFIVPNECHDAHSCPLSEGDAWLAQRVPPLVAAGADVVVVYDEGTTDLGIAGAGGGGHVFAAEIGPGVPAGAVVSTQLDHYALLAAIERRFGVSPIGNAASASSMPI